jgi:hypothetical protein
MASTKTRESWCRYFRGKDGQFAHLRDSFFSPSLPPRLPIDRRKCNRLLPKISRLRNSAERSYPNLMMLLKFPQTPLHNRGHPFTWFRFASHVPCSPFPFSTLRFPASLSPCPNKPQRTRSFPEQSRHLRPHQAPIASETHENPNPAHSLPYSLGRASRRGSGELSVEKVMPRNANPEEKTRCSYL